MLRIESETTGLGLTTLRATGRLSGPWVAELRRALASTDGQDMLVLDLTDVSFVDRDGIELLRTLKRHPRIALRCSAFVTAQLM